MEPVVLISILVGLIVLLLIVGAPIKPVRFIGNVAVKLIIGAVMLFLVNAFGSFFNFHIPINEVTTVVSGLLGVPGVVLLIIVKQFII